MFLQWIGSFCWSQYIQYTTSSRASFTLGTSRTCRACCSLRTLWALWTLGTLWALWALKTLQALGTCRSLRTLGACLTLTASCTVCHHKKGLGTISIINGIGVLQPTMYRSFNRDNTFTVSTICSVKTSRSLRTGLTLWSLRTLRASFTLRTLRALGSRCTSSSSGTRCASLTLWTLWARSTITQEESLGCTAILYDIDCITRVAGHNSKSRNISCLGSIQSVRNT